MSCTNPLLKRDDENEYAYHKRLVNGKLVDKTLAEYDYTELAKHVYGKEYASDVARRMMYGSARTMDLIDKCLGDSILESESDSVVADLKKRTEELRKERYKLQTEKLEYARWLREDARDELFEEKLLNSIKENVLPTEKIEPIRMEGGDKAAVLCLADFHFGKEYKIYGVFDEVINEYSPEIFYERMRQIFSETLEQIDRNGITELHVYNLGDSVEGFLRNSQLWSLRYGVIDSAVILGNYLADWLYNLSRFVNVKYFQTDGNHDELRMLDGKKNEHLNESAGKIVRSIIKIKNENNPNFALVENKAGLIYDRVAGFDILGIHGEVKDLSNAIREFSTVYGIDVSYLVAGHKHYSQYENCGVRKGVIGVGSVVGSDEYSMRLRKAADATASFIIFEEGKGKTDEHTFVLN